MHSKQTSAQLTSTYRKVIISWITPVGLSILVSQIGYWLVVKQSSFEAPFSKEAVIAMVVMAILGLLYVVSTIILLSLITTRALNHHTRYDGMIRIGYISLVVVALGWCGLKFWIDSLLNFVT